MTQTLACGTYPRIREAEDRRVKSSGASVLWPAREDHSPA